MRVFWCGYIKSWYKFWMKFFIKISIIYELKNRLTLLGIYNYHGLSLLIARLSYINNNDLFCYNFTYSQCYHLILIFMNVSSSCHLLIVPFMNIWSVRRFLILLYAMWYISYSIYKWYKSVMILNILRKYIHVTQDTGEWKVSYVVTHVTALHE